MSPMQRDHERWLEEAKRKKTKYIVNVCDTFDYDNYPVYCKDDKELAAARKKYNGTNMQQIDAVVDVKTGKTI